MSEQDHDTVVIKCLLWGWVHCHYHFFSLFPLITSQQPRLYINNQVTVLVTNSKFQPAPLWTEVKWLIIQTQHFCQFFTTHTLHTHTQPYSVSQLYEISTAKNFNMKAIDKYCRPECTPPTHTHIAWCSMQNITALQSTSSSTKSCNELQTSGYKIHQMLKLSQ